MERNAHINPKLNALFSESLPTGHDQFASAVAAREVVVVVPLSTVGPESGAH